MTAKEARVELVTYRTDHISEATVALITNFAKYPASMEPDSGLAQ